MAGKRKARAGKPSALPLPPDLDELFRKAGFRNPREARKHLPDLYLDASELIALARLSGLLKDLLPRCPDPDAAWFHLARFVSVRGSRLQLYQLFQDHPALLDRFIHLVGISSYLADILVRNPDALDLLSDPAWIPSDSASPHSDGKRQSQAAGRSHSDRIHTASYSNKQAA